MITYDEINAEWAKDGLDFKEDPDLARHSREQISIHQKYYSWMNQYYIKKLAYNVKLAKLQSDKTDYFSNEMDLAKIKELGWPVQPKRMVKAEVAKAVQNDPDVITLTQQIAYYNMVINYIEDIIKKLNQRSFDIRNIIEYEKFTAGIN